MVLSRLKTNSLADAEQKMFEEDQDVGSLLERSIVVNSLSLDVLLNVERDLPAFSPILEPYIRELVCLGIHSGCGEQRETAGNYFFLHNK